MPKPAKKLEDTKLTNFLDQHKMNIYVNQGTITKAMKIDQLIEVFKSYPNVGFVFSIRKDMKIGTELPKMF